MRFVPAEGLILEDILDATYPLWNEGLTRDAYGKWNAAQLKTAWGRGHLRRFALLDDRGRWVAAAKRYLWPMRLDGVDGVMCGVGAVFTRQEERGRGYGHAIVNQLVEHARGEGATVAGLFSERMRDMGAMIRFFETGLYVADTSVQAELFGPVPTMEETVRKMLIELGIPLQA